MDQEVVRLPRTRRRIPSALAGAPLRPSLDPRLASYLKSAIDAGESWEPAPVWSVASGHEMIVSAIGDFERYLRARKPLRR